MDFSVDAVTKFSIGSIGQDELFQALFSPEVLYETYQERFFRSPAKGLDRLSGSQYEALATDGFISASAKCANGSYRFTPYLERLKNKGRNKCPRVIGIPTIKDRVILCQLNAFLAAVFPACVARNVASGYVREISKDLESRSTSETWVCGTDIQRFYDDIVRAKLMDILSARITCAEVLNLVRRALLTPVVPATSRRSDRAQFKSAMGVPQGLAISNILAAIYVEDVDNAAKESPVTYYRYVDDILVYGSEGDVKSAYQLIRGMLQGKGLILHPMGAGKTTIAQISKEFGYLGYVFRLPLVTVRDSTVERFLQSIAAKFTDFRLGRNSLIKRFDYLDEGRLKDIFILELNEKITGAISESKRYGWISYFNQINDFQLLAKMDATIRRMFSRLGEFNGVAPLRLKKLHRAYYEMKYRPEAGCVHNYDVIIDRTQKLMFLVERGRIGPKETISDDEINKRYEVYRARVLKEMHADEGVLY